jgi:hypothetical protein
MSNLNAATTSPNNSNTEKRRSLRVHIAIPLLVRGGGNGTPTFEEDTSTVLVSAHGCMIRLAHKVERTQKITIINKQTAEELVCSVTFLGQTEGGKMEVGLEFAEPSPVFWRIGFPPEDWDPSERKRSSAQRPSSEPAR